MTHAIYWLLCAFPQNYFAERAIKKQSRKYTSDNGKPKINVAAFDALSVLNSLINVSLGLGVFAINKNHC